MESRNLVTFRTSAFNTTEPREYFINPGCFGDDLLTWLAGALTASGVAVDGEPDQEDFGWYVRFEVAGSPYDFVTGFRPPDPDSEGNADGLWIGWLEPALGLVASMLGKRRRKPVPAETAELVHAALASHPEISDIRWHDRERFERGDESHGATAPNG